MSIHPLRRVDRSKYTDSTMPEHPGAYLIGHTAFRYATFRLYSVEAGCVFHVVAIGGNRRHPHVSIATIVRGSQHTKRNFLMRRIGFCANDTNCLTLLDDARP